VRIRVCDPTRHTSSNLTSVFDPSCSHGCSYRSPPNANWRHLEPQLMHRNDRRARLLLPLCTLCKGTGQKGYFSLVPTPRKALQHKAFDRVERGLPHPNTLTIQLPPVFIRLRPTGLPGTVKECVLQIVSARLNDGVHQVSKAEIALAIRQVGGSVSRSGLKLALAEMSEGTNRVPPRLRRVAPGRYTLRSAAT